MYKIKSIVGQRFGRLLITSRAPSQVQPSCTRSRWNAVCNCGKKVAVSGHHLKSGNVKSCGCLRVDSGRKLCTKHGEFKNGKWSPEYQVWQAMKARCLNKKMKRYKDYGGRGIGISKRWERSFIEFLKDVGRRPTSKHSIDRINNEKGYFPKNVKWSTASEQCRNRRPRKMAAKERRFSTAPE